MSDQLFSVENKICIVTGGLGQIGKNFVQELWKRGARVAVWGRTVNDERIAKTLGEEALKTSALRFYSVDITKKEEMNAALDDMEEVWGDAPDVLVNNAQASASGVTLADHTTDQFDLAIYSGLYATFYYMQACYPYLKETKGSVINFASGAGLFGNFGQCAYAAAKEGIRGMSRVAATEWGPDGINVNVVCPLAWTAALENFQEAYPDAFTANVHMPPMGHYGNVETEIGRVVVQLASPDFKFMSGETLTLEGGMGQRP